MKPYVNMLTIVFIFSFQTNYKNSLGQQWPYILCVQIVSACKCSPSHFPLHMLSMYTCKYVWSARVWYDIGIHRSQDDLLVSRYSVYIPLPKNSKPMKYGWLSRLKQECVIYHNMLIFCMKLACSSSREHSYTYSSMY